MIDSDGLRRQVEQAEPVVFEDHAFHDKGHLRCDHSLTIALYLGKFHRFSVPQHIRKPYPVFFRRSTIQRIQVMFEVIDNRHSDRFNEGFDGLMWIPTLRDDIEVKTMPNPLALDIFRGLDND